MDDLELVIVVYIVGWIAVGSLTFIAVIMVSILREW